MAQTAAKFDNANQSLTSMLNTLMSELSSLQTAWVGRGGRAFEQVKVQYEQDLSKLNRALSETAVSIRESGKSYDATDDSSADAITKSGSGYLPLEN
jgi:WXG100 family type VII secretion target